MSPLQKLIKNLGGECIPGFFETDESIKRLELRINKMMKEEFKKLKGIHWPKKNKTAKRMKDMY